MLNKLCQLRSKIVYPLRRIINSDIKKNDLVVDLGCGGLPNPRANVAVDFIDDDLERADKLKIDRPFVWASIDKLPFKEKAFDYSILSHVLEHLENPREALDEIQRIAKAGYIETPNAFYEYTISHTYHVSRVTVMDGVLNISFKPKWDDTYPYPDVARDAVRLFHHITKLDVNTLLTRYKWKDKIDYQINGIPFIKDDSLMSTDVDPRSAIKKFLIKLVYAYHKLWLKPVNLKDILVCPKCHGQLIFEEQQCECKECKSVYEQYKGHFDFRVTGL